MASENNPQNSGAEGDQGLAARAQDAAQRVRETADAAGNRVSAHAHDAANRLRETVDEAGNRLHHGYDSAREFVSERGDRIGKAIAEHPGPSVLFSLGLGFGIGLALSAILAPRREDHWYSRYVPDSVRDATGRLGDLRLRERISERLSRS